MGGGSRAPVRGALIGRGLFGNLARTPPPTGPPDVGFPSGKSSSVSAVCKPVSTAENAPKVGAHLRPCRGDLSPLRGWEVLAPGAPPPQRWRVWWRAVPRGGQRPEQEGCWDNFVVIGRKAAGHQFCPSRSRQARSLLGGAS